MGKSNRKTHNFALDMNWLPACVIPKRQWPAIRFKEKRAITIEEHQQIIAAEVNPERKTLYQLCWHLGASQRVIWRCWQNRTGYREEFYEAALRKNGSPLVALFDRVALGKS